jgi:hypothetical protein
MPDPSGLLTWGAGDATSVLGHCMGAPTFYEASLLRLTVRFACWLASRRSWLALLPSRLLRRPSWLFAARALFPFSCAVLCVSDRALIFCVPQRTHRQWNCPAQIAPIGVAFLFMTFFIHDGAFTPLLCASSMLFGVALIAVPA